MELLYVWIEDYKNIRRQGFNFSPKHHFEFVPDNKDKNTNSEIIGGKLTLKEKDYSLPDNFFGDNIVNITGIVGKNGSGKSSLLEFIAKWMNQSDFIHFTVYKSENQKIIIYKKDNFKIKSKFETDNNLQGIKNILFTNTFNITTYDFIDWGYKDTILATPFNELRKIEEDNKNSIFIEYWFNNLKAINNLLLKDIWKKDIQSFLGKKNGIEKIVIEINLNKFPNYNHFFQFFRKDNNSKQNTLFFFMYASILQTINKKSQELDIKVDKIRDVLKNKDLLDKNTGKTKTFLKELYELINCDKKEFIEKWKGFIKTEFIELINYIKKTIPEESFSYHHNYISSFDIKLEKLNSFLYKYKKTINTGSYLEFYWGLSSGELAIVNLFAKLLDAKEKININKVTTSKKDTIKTYLILLDEIDLYLHPEWSKQNIYLLTKVLPLIFDKPVQIIATAHSPFIVSDLPKEHIIFLDKDQETGNCKVIPEIDQKQTFGANIHTLFTDAFFQDGLIGKFAEEKIQKAITYLNEQELSEDEIKYCKEIIQITGEPILKNQLQKMLTSKLETKNKSEIDILKKQMKYLKSKISKLENKNKKR